MLESDGTEIDSGAVLKMFNKETFILLSKEERWNPENNLNDVSFSSGASTVTVDSTPDVTENQEINFSLRSTTISEETWEHFDIPWNMLGSSRLAECQKGININNHIQKLIQVTVDAVRDISKHPGCKALKIIAKKIVKDNVYFKDVDEDNVQIGSGYSSIFKKLLERNNYLNRPHKRSPNQMDPHDLPPSKIKNMMSRKAGK